MSALPPKADIGTQSRNVRFVPKADICSAAKERLFDHFVGDGEHAWRNGETECLRGFQVDHQIELSRLHHRQIGGLLALENPSGKNSSLPAHIGKADAVTD